MLALIFERLNPLQRSLIGALFGLLGYGVWAYLVNSMHGQAAALKAACVQGSYSFALTFVMTVLIESLYGLADRIFDAALANKIFTIVITCAIIFSTSWWVNVMAGTPEIFNTVILGYIVGGLYTISYVFGLAGDKIPK